MSNMEDFGPSIPSSWGEPAPIKNNQTPVWELVIEDMKSRDSFGREKYGTPLQTFNGRNPLQDAYEEILDAAVYLKQAILEQKKNAVSNHSSSK